MSVEQSSGRRLLPCAIWVVLAVLVLLGSYVWIRRSTARRNAATPRNAATANDAPTPESRWPTHIDPASGPVETDPPTDAPRTEPPLVALRGRVSDDAGRSVGGVEITWTPLPEGDLDIPANLAAVDWSASIAATETTTSRDDGSFEFQRAPPGTSSLGFVLWFTEPAHVAEPVLLDTEPSTWPASIECELERRIGATVRVLDGDGAAIAGASVEHFALDPPRDVASDNRSTRAYRIFHRAWTTDVDGELRAAVPRGQQTFTARSRDRIAKPWIGDAPFGQSIDLRVGASFTLDGRIDFSNAAPDGTPLFVGYWVFDRDAYVDLFETKVRADSTFGPFELPVLGVAKCAFRLHGGGSLPRTIAREEPQPGEHVRIEFAAITGSSLAIRAVDKRTRSPVPGAKVEVWSLVSAGDQRRSEARSDANGIARVAGVTDGTLTVRVEARGYVPLSWGPVDYPPEEPQPIDYFLVRAGRLAGRVTHDGEPVREFKLIYWQGESFEVKTRDFAERVDGRFELDEAPLGEVVVVAAASALPSCDPIHVVVPPDGVAEVELELPRACTAHGRVVDAATNEPVDGATVIAQSNFGEIALAPQGVGVVANERGEFRIGGLKLGLNRLRVGNQGYANLELGPVLTECADFDLGDLRLVRHQALDVQLVGLDDTDFSGWRLEFTGPEQAPFVDFDATGRAHIDEFAPGEWLLCARAPDGGSERCVTEQLRVGPSWRVELDVGGDASLAVEVAEVDGAKLPEPTWLRAFTEERGRSYERWTKLTPGTHGRFDHLRGGHAIVDVVDRSYFALATGAAPLARGENALRLEFGGRPFEVRVVDSRRAPIAAAIVYLRAPAENASWTAWRSANSDGVATFPHLPFERVDVSANHPDHGWVVSVAVETRDAREQPVVVELASRARLRARLVDGSTPLPRVEASVRDVHGMALGYVTSDATGNIDYGPLNEARFRVEIDAAGYWPTSAAIEAKEHAEFTPVQVRRLGGLVVRARDARSGALLVNASVALRSIEYEADVATWIAEHRAPSPEHGLTTDSSGQLTVPGLPNGEYLCTIGGASQIAVVPPHATATVDLLVP